MNFKGKTVLITGGSSGIGRELTAQFVGAGAKVIIVARDEARLTAIQNAAPESISIIRADLTRVEDQDRVVDHVVRSWPDLALLINNAGVQINLPPVCVGDDGEMDRLRDEIAINLTAPVALSFGLMSLLAQQKEAAIVNISSGLAVAPMRTAPVYCATKAGLSMFSRALRYRCEDATPTIRVVDVIVPTVDTEMSTDRTIAKMSAKDAARAILKGIAQSKNEIWVGRARLLRLVHRLSPKTAYRTIRNG